MPGRYRHHEYTLSAYIIQYAGHAKEKRYYNYIQNDEMYIIHNIIIPLLCTHNIVRYTSIRTPVPTCNYMYYLCRKYIILSRVIYETACFIIQSKDKYAHNILLSSSVCLGKIVLLSFTTTIDVGSIKVLRSTGRWRVRRSVAADK